MYNYAIIGNCQISAMISKQASLDWLCLPRPDSPPVFGKILDSKSGCFQVIPVDNFTVKQEYIENSNVLETEFTLKSGASFKIIDFVPRFEQFGRTYKPTMIIRMLKPIEGSSPIRVSCEPILGWCKSKPKSIRGNSHLSFSGYPEEMRLTTNFPLTYLNMEQTFLLQENIYFALTWGEPVEADLSDVCESFLRKTIFYWREWVKSCSIPSLFQRETIRSALVLKLHCYEDTGAVLAAMTTSLPEEMGSNRNWDYRYCWLRDACFTVSAFYRLGHYTELQNLMRFIVELLARSEGGRLHPVYRLDGTLPLPEQNCCDWEGYAKSQPVRNGNQAAEHIQNDVYGEIMLALVPLYYDERFRDLRKSSDANFIFKLAQRAHAALKEPDAGLWEHRAGWKIHAFTLLMSWAGLDRYARLIETAKIEGPLDTVKAWRHEAYESILSCSSPLGVVTNASHDDSLDASLLLLEKLRFPDLNIRHQTVKAIEQSLTLPSCERLGLEPHPYLFRYLRNDDFGQPKHAFLICSFWLIEALALQGQVSKARGFLEQILGASNHVGLFAEHFNPFINQQTGNFPQCYSHVGLIHAAFAVSPNWDRVL